MRTGFVLLALALGACAATSPPPPSSPGDRVQPARVATPLFELRTGFWVSLHHHLRGEARRLPVALEGKLPRDPDPATLPADERAAWEASLTAYGRTMAKRDLLFGDEMVEIKNALADLQDASGLSTLRGRFDDEALDALERAAPVYRALLWPEHERKARAWIAEMSPLVARYGPAIAPRLAALYDTSWGTIPVEVLPEAGAVDAYTSANPTRISISCQNPELVGFPALEILFHESSHGWDLRNPLASEAYRSGVTIPDNLWHALLFYLAGEVVRSELERAGTPGYVLYVDAQGLWKQEWEGLREPIAAACDPWLRGERTRAEALHAIVTAVGKPRSKES